MKADVNPAKSTTPDELKNLWQTPSYVRAWAKSEYTLGFDAASDNKNRVVAPNWTMEDNALAQVWAPLPDRNSWYWCNPPYDDIGPWVDKACEGMILGARTVMLVPADFTTGWALTALANMTLVRIITGGRIQFKDPMTAEQLKEVVGDKKRDSNTKGSVLYEFDGLNYQLAGLQRTSYIPLSEIKRTGQRLLKQN